MTTEVREIELTKVAPSPDNPRKKFDIEDLVISIGQQGVISPILIRAKKSGKKEFEIVYGERRYRACTELNMETVPAIIRDLDDAAAFEFMTVENLQRHNLGPLEEANSFRAYLNREKTNTVEDLAERTGIKAPFIRKRVAILGLGKNILKAWNDGKLYYGHLEQFLRLRDKATIAGLFHDVLKGDWRNPNGLSVGWLRQEIDSISPLLDKAKFDVATECAGCCLNSDVQRQLFDMVSDEAKCTNRPCFKEKQGAYLSKNWKKSGYRRKHKTNGFRFREDLVEVPHRTVWPKPIDKCFTCDKFVSVLHLEGLTYEEQCCLDPDCWTRNQKSDAPKKQQKKDGPRVDWHGSYFREKFFETAIPVQIQKRKPTDMDIKRLALFSLLKSNRPLHLWFAEATGYLSAKQVKDEDAEWYGMERATIFTQISTMDAKKVNHYFKELSLLVVLQDQYDTTTRRRIAEYLGISLSKEWAVTDEYFAKKTKQEILDFGWASGLFDDEKVQTYLTTTLGKKVGKYNGLKKPELVDLFLKSGVDLVGKVPEEILNEETK